MGKRPCVRPDAWYRCPGTYVRLTARCEALRTKPPLLPKAHVVPRTTQRVRPPQHAALPTTHYLLLSRCEALPEHQALVRTACTALPTVNAALHGARVAVPTGREYLQAAGVMVCAWLEGIPLLHVHGTNEGASLRLRHAWLNTEQRAWTSPRENSRKNCRSRNARHRTRETPTYLYIQLYSQPQYRGHALHLHHRLRGNHE